MKSAYVTLGVPGNVSHDDIERAYAIALGHFSKEKLVSDPALIASLDEVKEAYKILSNPDWRKAHDRKLSGLVASPAVRLVSVPEQEKSTSSFVLKWMGIVVIAMFAVGTYFSHVHGEAQKERAAREVAQKRADDEQAAQAARDIEAAAANRASINALADRNERQLRSESAVAARQAQAIEVVQQAVRSRQDEYAKNDARNEERQRAATAQQRVVDDQRRIRNLCMINYGKPNC